MDRQMTGAPPPNATPLPASTVDLSHDMVTGAKAIAAVLGLTERQVFHLHEESDIPIFKLGKRKKSPLVARRSALVQWVMDKERAALERRGA